MSLYEQKVLPGRYQVSPRTLSFVLCGQQVLLLRGAPDKRLWPNRLNGIGGHVEANEDVYSAARREIIEETGLEVDRLQLCAIVNIPTSTPNRGILLFVFRAEVETAKVHPSEEGKLKWFPVNALPALSELVEDLPILLPRVLAIAPDAPPIFGLYQYDNSGRLRVTFMPP